MAQEYYDGPTIDSSQYNAGAAIGKYPQQLMPPTDRKRFEQKKAMLEFELQKVNAALKALDDHPDLEEFANVLAAAR